MMKTLVTFILITISLSAIGQTEKPITKTELLIADTNIIFKHFEDIQIFQFFDDDSLNGKITNSKKLDINRNVIAEYFTDYMTDNANGSVDILEINEYNENNKLIISTSYFETFQNGEVQKSFFYYNDSLLVRVESFDLKRRLKSDVDKGFGKPGGNIIMPEDYEKEPTWMINQIDLYQYDSLGRLILRYSPIFQNSQNRFEYQYNEDGNLIVEKSLDESRPIYTIKYQYKENQTISNLQWDNENWRGTIQIKTFDKFGNLIKESTIKNDEEWIDIYEYNVENKLIRFSAYNSDGEIGLTHIYKYKE